MKGSQVRGLAHASLRAQVFHLHWAQEVGWPISGSGVGLAISS